MMQDWPRRSLWVAAQSSMTHGIHGAAGFEVTNDGLLAQLHGVHLILSMSIDINFIRMLHVQCRRELEGREKQLALSGTGILVPECIVQLVKFMAEPSAAYLEQWCTCLWASSGPGPADCSRHPKTAADLCCRPLSTHAS